MNSPTKALWGLAAALAIGTGAAGCSYLSVGQSAWVAKVNGHAITVKDYDLAIDQAKKQYSSRYGVDFTSAQGMQLLDSIKGSVIQRLTEQELLSEEVERRGIKATDKDIEDKVQSIRKQFPDVATFQKALQSYGLTEADLRGQISKGVAIEKLQMTTGASISVTEDDLHAFYDHNKASFKHDEEVNARHILVKFDPAAKDKAKDEAATLAKIKEIQGKLKAGGDFAKLAKEYSDDPGSKAQGGDLGFFGKGRMVPPFEKAAFSLKEGQVSAPVKTQFGYHLIQGGAHHAPYTESFDQVHSQIQDRLKQQKQGQAFQTFVADLKKDAKIEYKPEYAPKQPQLAPQGAAPQGAAPATAGKAGKP